MQNERKVLPADLCECGLPDLPPHGLAQHGALMRNQVAQALAIPSEKTVRAEAV